GSGESTKTPKSASLEVTPMAGPRSIDMTPDCKRYLVLREGNRVCAVDVARRQLKLIAGTSEIGYSGDGGPAVNAKLNGPKGIAYSAEGALYVSDTENHVIRRIDLRTGMISTVIGTGQRGDEP